MSENKPTDAAVRYPYLSLIRVISCIGIMILHTYYVYVSYFPSTEAQQTWSLAVRNAMMWAVPCFVMVTGALLLDPAREVSIRKLFSKYILRAALAIVVFTLIFYAFDLWLGGRSPRLADLGAVLLKIYTDGSWSHMWYLYMLIGLYLLMPAFRLISAGADPRTLRYLLLIGLIFMLVLPTIDQLTGIRTGFYISVYTVYPFYLFLGYAIHRRIVRLPRALGALMFISGILAAAVLTKLQLAYEIDNLKKLLPNYSFVPNALMAAGLYSLLQPKEASHMKDTKLLTFLDRNSFGIYLIHYLVLKLAVTQLPWNPYQSGGVALLIGISVVVFLISLCLTCLLRLIPGVKKLL